MTYVIGSPASTSKTAPAWTSASPVEAIYYEDDLPESLQPYTEENVKFFNHDR